MPGLRPEAESLLSVLGGLRTWGDQLKQRVIDELVTAPALALVQ
jgi:hypothetical protein